MGYINSIETMGLVDGPGIRFVVFMQGCKLRCLFCHNPETWKMESETIITPEELIAKILKYKSYFGELGGVTFSGGEPLVQTEFLIKILKLCKENNINTCLDTAGVGGTNNEEVLKYVDLVMFCVKALDSDEYKKLTGFDIDESLRFLNLCQTLNKKLWIRQVILPEFNDNKNYMIHLKRFLNNYTIEKVEFLPYETLGVPKYRKLGMPYRLGNLKAMNKEECKELFEYFNTVEV